MKQTFILIFVWTTEWKITWECQNFLVQNRLEYVSLFLTHEHDTNTIIIGIMLLNHRITWIILGVIGDICNVFKFHAYSVNKKVVLDDRKACQSLPDLATTNECKVDTSNRNHIERSRWIKWLVNRLQQKKYPLIWIHYKSGLFCIN